MCVRDGGHEDSRKRVKWLPWRQRFCNEDSNILCGIREVSEGVTYRLQWSCDMNEDLLTDLYVTQITHAGYALDSCLV